MKDLYRLDEGALRDLDAELVVTQDLCSVCAVDLNDVGAALDRLGCRAEVLTLDPMTLEQVLASIRTWWCRWADGPAQRASDV